MPKYRMLAKGEDNNITLHPETTADNVLMSESDSTTVSEKFEEYATKEKGVYYVEGNGVTTGRWLGSHSEITSYFDGLTVLYETNVAGGSAGTTLNINGLGAKAVYRANTTKLTTQYGVRSVIILAYMADLNSGCWMVLGDYDNHLYEYHVYCGGTDVPEGYLTFTMLSTSASYLSTGSLTSSYLSTIASKLYSLGHLSVKSSLDANGQFRDPDDGAFSHIFGVYSPNGTTFYICNNYDGYDFNSHTISVEQVEITRKQIF